MTNDEFWSLIDLLDWEKTGDDEAVIEPLVKSLSQKAEEEILAFEDILSEKLFNLDAEVFATKRNIFGFKKRNEYISADDFLYSRCTVVANGPEYYDEVIRNPRKFPHDLDFEIILVVATVAFIRKTGKEWDYVPKVSYETFSNKEAWKYIHNKAFNSLPAVAGIRRCAAHPLAQR